MARSASDVAEIDEIQKTDYICTSKESERPAPDTLDETLPTWNSDKEWETLTVEEFKEEILYQWQLFNDVSWFHLLMNANEEDFDGLTNEVIAEYAQIKGPKVCATLSAMIKAYIKMLKLFKEKDKLIAADQMYHQYRFEMYRL